MAEQSDVKPMREVKSCGFFVMKPDQSFLLMKHVDWYDLPKGHMEAGETEKDTAIRELMEETGIQSSEIDIDPGFRFENVYYPISERFSGERVRKTLVVFLARLKSNTVDIKLTEHPDFQWFSWNSPPTAIQEKTVDPLVAKVHAYLQA